MRLRIRNPFPPYPETPEGTTQRKWLGAIDNYRPFVVYALKSLREDLLTKGVPEDKLPKDLDPVIDTVTVSLARIENKSDPFWDTVSPEQFASDTLHALFPEAGNAARTKSEIEYATRALADRIREDLNEAGRTPVAPEREVPLPATLETKPPASRKPSRVAKEAVVIPAPERLQVTPEVRAEIEEQIENVAETLSPPPETGTPAPSAKRRPPTVPAAARRRASGGRASGGRASAGRASGGRSRRDAAEDGPPSLRVEGIPRVKALSEATLRAEREYFYEDDDALASRGCPQERRMRGFWPYLAGIRPTYRPPAATLVKHKDDILLMVIPPGNVVQVFTKGQVTEVFASSRTENALHIAARYANQWRGVNDEGDVMRDAKRSRLKTGIYAAYYTGKNTLSDIVQLAEPILEVMERDPEMSGRRVSNPAPRGGLPAPRARYAPVDSTRRSEMRTRDLGSSPAPLIIRIRNPRR